MMTTASIEQRKRKACDRAKAWREANPERYRAALRSWYLKNKERATVKTAMWRTANPGRRSAESKKYRERHPEVASASKRAWNFRNPEYQKLQAHRRRAKLQDAVHPENNLDAEMAVHTACVQMTATTGAAHEVDHVIPVAAGGFHHHLNLQVLPISMNRSKHADPFWQMPGYKSWRDVPEYLWPEKLVPSYRAIIEKERPIPQN